MIRTSRLLLVLTAFLLTSCTSEEGIQVHSPWMMPAVEGENTAVYFRLFNHMSEGELLISVSSDVSDGVELNESASDGKVVQMRKVEQVLLPASTEVSFGPGLRQVMLLGLKQDLHLRDEIEITLHFLHYPDVVVKVPVRNFPPPSEAGEHH